MDVRLTHCRWALAFLVAVVAAAACRSGDGGGGELAWITSGDGLEETTLVVPLDHDRPDGPTVELSVWRRRATDPEARIGTLLVNPGGPGLGGADSIRRAERFFPPDVRQRFDVVSWDPRGTAGSRPAIDCVDDRDALVLDVDITPDDDGERRRLRDVASTYAASCAQRTGELLQYVSTVTVARDIDAIRRALGEDEISYLGFSYGSELGATWLTMFPATVRAAVLDGAVDVGADEVERTVQQAAGFERALSTFLADCSATATCAFHNGGDADGAFDGLLADLDAAPLPSPDGRPPVTQYVALGAVRQALYAETFWDPLAAALAVAQAGDGSGLLRIWDAAQQRRPDGTWSDVLDAFDVITCMDQAERATPAEAEALTAAVAAAAPRIGPLFTSGDVCSFLPPSRHPRPALASTGPTPVLVIATTGDPATPLAGTRATAERLAAAGVVTVDAEQHTGYGTNECVDHAVSAFLADPASRPGEISC